jgi:hypothetical protein
MMNFVLFGFGKPIGTFLMFRLVIVPVVVFFESFGIIVGVYILGAGLVAIILIGSCSGTHHVALTIEVDADFIGFGLDALRAIS